MGSEAVCLYGEKDLQTRVIAKRPVTEGVNKWLPSVYIPYKKKQCLYWSPGKFTCNNPYILITSPFMRFTVATESEALRHWRRPRFICPPGSYQGSLIVILCDVMRSCMAG